MPPRPPHIALRLLVAALAAGAALGAASTPGLVLAAASGPALAWTLVVLLAAGRRRPPWDVVAATLLGGAVLAASLAAGANEVALARGALGAGRVPILVGPLVEETAKGLVLALVVALRREAFDGPRAGLVWGALVGLGFTWHENLQYLALAALQGGWPGLEQGIAVRGLVGGPVHAVFAAATGVGLGWALAAPAGSVARIAVGAVGIAAAVGQHVAWNAVGSVLVMQALCGPGFPALGCARPPRRWPPPAVLLVTLAFTAPGAGLAWLASRRGPRDS
ncbi:MAG: PrsW family intramembrane metalloprotease [bacterium]|nr:PrsW family intramembrane metalloprotease [bacterium]